MKMNFLRLKFAELRRWRPGKLAKGTLSLSSGIGSRAIGQAAVFFMVARILGVEAYGAYAAVMAIAATLGNFSGIGVRITMLRDVSRDPTCFAISWGRTLTAIGLSSPALLLIFFLITYTVFPTGISWVAIACIGVAEIVLLPIVQAGSSAYQGHEMMGRVSRLVLAPVLPRLAGALLLFPLTHLLPIVDPFSLWTGLYAIAGAIAVYYTLWIVHHDFGGPKKPGWKKLIVSLKDGFSFTMVSTAQKLYTDIDKTMLARLVTFKDAGAYSAAYRITDMFAVPIVALLVAGMPRFFQISQNDSKGGIAFALRLLPLPLLYSFFAGLCLFIASPWLPVILGPSFMALTSTMKWLAWLPLLSLPRLFLQTVFLTGNRQGTLVPVLGLGALLNVILNLWLIPKMGWRGAVIATYGAELTMGIVMALVISKTTHS